MNIFTPLIALCLFLGAPTPEPQTDHTKQIADMIKSGDGEQLSNYFTGIVDLTVMDKEDMYSRAQAKLIVIEFFNNHAPKSFQFNHKGNLQNDREYRIGKLKTGNGSYRVAFYMKPVGDNFRIYQLSITQE